MAYIHRIESLTCGLPRDLKLRNGTFVVASD